MEDLCSACLCAGRNLNFIGDTKSYQVYSQILTEIPVYDLSQVTVQICWECKAMLRRFELFKDQVKTSYCKLLDFVYQKSSKSSITSNSHLQIHHLNSINYPEVDVKLERDEELSVEVKSEIEDVEHNEPETFVNNLDLDKIMKKKDLGKKVVKPKEKAKKKVKEKTKKKVKEKKNKSVKKSKKETQSIDYSDVDDTDFLDNLSEDNKVESVEKDVLIEECQKSEVDGLAKKEKKAAKLNGVSAQKREEKEILPERPQCVECGKIFSSRKTYRYHLNVLHKGQNRYPCPRCGKVYQWKSNLGRHMRSHKARDSGELYCSMCDKRFASVATYRQHLRVSRRHVAETDFSFVCNECGKKFVNKTRLRDHIDWEHLKKIKFKCQLCNKPFKCHTSLYVHLQNVHRNKEKKDNLCHVCGKSYQNSAKLKYHIVAMHTSETPYQCPQCSAAFGWYSSLYRHVREVHYKVKLQPKKSKKAKKTDVLPSMLPEPIVLPHLHIPGTS